MSAVTESPTPYYNGQPPVTNVVVKASTAPDTSCKPGEFWLPLFCLYMPWHSFFIPSLHPAPVPNLYLHFLLRMCHNLLASSSWPDMSPCFHEDGLFLPTDSAVSEGQQALLEFFPLQRHLL